VADTTFACPDLTTFCRLDELGLVVTGQRLEPDRAVLACRIVQEDRWWLIPIEGVATAAAWSAGWRTNRSGGARRRWR
jgi:hypothetical protein